MCPITEEQAIELARKFLENKGEIIIEYLSTFHLTKEILESQDAGPFTSGQFLVRFSVVTPPDAKYKVTDPEGDIRIITVNDNTGKTDYLSTY